MELGKLLPVLRELSHADKLRAMHFLVLELAREDEALLNSPAEYPIWTPYNVFDGADTLLKVLQVEDA